MPKADRSSDLKLADRATCPASKQAKRERRSVELEDVGAEAPWVASGCFGFFRRFRTVQG